MKEFEISKIISEKLRQRYEQESKYGKVKPMISADFQNNKFVAVGDTLHYAPNWKTVPDFLFDYIKRVLGGDWYKAELQKLLEDRHKIIQWYVDVERYKAKQVKDDDGIYRVVQNGSLAAYSALAYDLYVLKSYSLLQQDIIRRLKIPEQFRGARYELFAMACCIRAGFDIELEDEKDRSRNHPEFIATHRETKQKLAIEAKSKKDGDRIRVGQLINQALKKVTPFPLVVFVDLNIPPELAKKEMETPPPNTVSKILDQIIQSDDGRDRYAMIIFTNQPYQYSLGDAPMSKKHVLSVVSQNPTVQTPNSEILWSLNTAALQDKIPNEFPEA